MRSVGVDPGGRDTGIVSRTGSTLLRAVTVHREGDSKFPGRDYLLEVLDVLDDLVDDEDCVISVEGLVEPGGFKGGKRAPISLAGIMGTSMVFSIILVAYPEAVVVPPGGNGSAPMAAYPKDLRPTRGVGAGHDKLRHLRSAWDVAGAAGLVAAGAHR